jgi:predicted GH43/DUF377 family glycosyl hydrolase
MSGGFVLGRTYVLIPVLLLTLVLVVPSQALDVTVDNEIPEYILQDHLNLTGSSSMSSSKWVDATTSDFSKGTTTNVSVTSGTVTLSPELDFKILNSGNPVLSPGSTPEWDRVLMTGFDVIAVSGTYYMFYVGSLGTSLTTLRHIGVATSSDGISWTKYSGNPVLRAGVDSYDRTNLNDPEVVYHNNTFHLWYGGNHLWYGGNHGNQGGGMQDVDICYATSPDGFNWTKSASNPVMQNGGEAWNRHALRPFDVQMNGTTFVMYYKAVTATGGGPKPWLALATSTDGVSWVQNTSNPLRQSPANGWEEGQTECGTWETANGTHRIWTMADGTPWKLGYIWSKNGVDWTDSGGPILSPKGGTIYSSHIKFPAIVKEGDTYLLYAKCVNNAGTRTIGAFRVTPQKMDGSFVSRIYDAGGPVSVTGFGWNFTNLIGPSGTEVISKGGHADYYFRYANSTDDWSTWRYMNPWSNIWGLSARYFQYKIAFTAYADWFRVRHDNFTLSFDIPISSIEVRVDGGAWEDVNGTFAEWYRNVSLHDGDYGIGLRVTDSIGGVVVKSFPVKVDLYPPTGNITIEEGRFATNSTNVLIEMEAFDTHGPIMVQLSRRPDFQGATWNQLYSGVYGILNDPYGPVTVYARFRDAAGRISETYNDTIVIDTRPPEGLLLIDDGAKYTKTTAVALNVSWVDLTGVVAMQVSNDPAFEGALWQDPMERFAWQIGEIDGEQTVYVRIQDAVGWVTTLSDSIILDRTIPSASISIEDDAPFTTSLDVKLDITLHDEHPIRFKLANSGDPWPDAWRDLASPIEIPWTLSSGPDGRREVSLLVEDAAGNTVTIGDDIILDTTPPEGEISIDGGARFTTSVLVQIELNASDATSGLDKMRVWSDENPPRETWQSVKGFFDWTLEPGDGHKTVYVEIRDMAGLTTTLDASIIIDMTPPKGTMSIEGVWEYAITNQVTLALFISDNYGLANMRIANDQSFDSSVWVPYSSTVPWNLGETEGNVWVYLEVTDHAGNSFIASVSTILDLTDPIVSIEVNDGDEATLLLSVLGLWAASDANGITEAAFSEDGSFTTPQWRPTVPQGSVEGMVLEFNFTGSDGLKILYIRVRDESVRTSTASDDIWYVSSRPEGTLTIVGYGGLLDWTNHTSVDTRFSWTDASPVTDYRQAFTIEDLSDSEWHPVTMNELIYMELQGEDGEKVLYAQLLGPHNVSSLPFSDSIILDTQPPTVVLVQPTRTRTEEGSVPLNVSVSDNIDPSPVIKWRVNGGEWRPYTGQDRVSLKEGKNLIEIAARDHATNLGVASTEIVLDQGFEVSAGSWLILLVLLVVAAGVGFWYGNELRKKRAEERG